MSIGERSKVLAGDKIIKKPPFPLLADEVTSAVFRFLGMSTLFNRVLVPLFGKGCLERNKRNSGEHFFTNGATGGIMVNDLSSRWRLSQQRLGTRQSKFLYVIVYAEERFSRTVRPLSARQAIRYGSSPE